MGGAITVFDGTLKSSFKEVIMDDSEHSPLERLIAVLNSALEFRSDNLVESISAEATKNLSLIKELLLAMQKLCVVKSQISDQIKAQVARAELIPALIDRALHTPSPQVTSFEITQRETRSSFDSLLASDISDPALRASISQCREIVDQGVRSAPALDLMFRKSESVLLLLKLAEVTSALYASTQTSAMNEPVRKPKLLNVLHMRILEYRIRRSFREQKTLWQWSKLISVLQLILRLMNLVPSKLEMLVSALTLRLELKEDRVRSFQDIRALLSISPMIFQAAAIETDEVSRLFKLLKLLDQALAE